MLKSGCANRADFIEALKAIGKHHIAQDILSHNGKDVAVLKLLQNISMLI